MPASRSGTCVIHHINEHRTEADGTVLELRPESADKAMELLQTAGKNVHINNNAMKLLKYYGTQEEGFVVHYNATERIVGISRSSDSRRQLVDHGLIYYRQYDTITIDWQRIYLFANYLTRTKTAARTANVRVMQLCPERGQTLRHQLEAHSILFNSDTELDNMFDLVEKQFVDAMVKLSSVYGSNS